MLTTSTTTERVSVLERTRPPTHPGAIIRHECLEPLSLSITRLARDLGVSRKTVSKIVNERGAVTAEMALRLGRAFGTSPHVWLDLQKDWELWHAAHDTVDWKRARPVD